MTKFFSIAVFVVACLFLVSIAKADDQVEVKFGPCITAKTMKELKAAKAELVAYSAARAPIAIATKSNGMTKVTVHPEMQRIMAAVKLPDISDVGLLTKRKATAEGHVVMRLRAKAGK